MNRQVLLFGVLFLGALICWRLLDGGASREGATQQEHFQPDFVASDLVAHQYDEQGRLRERLESPHAEYFGATEMANLQAPNLTLYDKGGTPAWKVTAKEGVLNLNDNALLRGQVHLEGLLPQGMVKSMDTEYLELDLTNQDVRSNERVKILGHVFQSEGIGLKGNLDTRYLELLEQSHAIYFNQKR